jgi:membrane-associated protein
VVEEWLSQFSVVLLYLVVWVIVFAETGLLVGFLLPGDTLLFAAGLIVAQTPGANVWVMAGGVLVAAVVGDQVGYTIGLRLGRPYVARRGPRVQLGVAKAEEFYARYGWFAVVAARWIPWVRTFVPFVAGVAKMPRSRFLAANIVGAVIWGPGLIVLGYWAAQIPWLQDAAIVVAVVVVAVSMLAGVWAWWRERRLGSQSLG